MSSQQRINLEKKFHTAMLEIYDLAKSEAGYVATRFRQMVLEKGGLPTAKYLIGEPTVSEGFTQLALRERLDLTVETLIQQQEWRSLFSNQELKIAAQRLKPKKD